MKTMYTPDGHEVRVIRQLDDDKYIVTYMLRADEFDEEVPSKEEVYNGILLDSPPVKKFAAQLDDVINEINTAKAQLRTIMAEVAARQRLFTADKSNNDGYSRLAMLKDGRATHYVLTQTGDIEEIADTDSLTAIITFKGGRTRFKFELQANDWYTKSVVVPCASYDDALNELCSRIKSGDINTIHAVEAAMKYGITACVTDEDVRQYISRKSNALRSTITKARETISRAEETIKTASEELKRVQQQSTE